MPIILRPCDWQSSPLGELQALPREARPIVRWQDRDEAFLDVVRGVRLVVNELRRAILAPATRNEVATPIKPVVELAAKREENSLSRERTNPKDGSVLVYVPGGEYGKRSGGFGVFGPQEMVRNPVVTTPPRTPPNGEGLPVTVRRPRGEQVWKGAVLSRGRDGVEACQGGKKRAVDENRVISTEVLKELKKKDAKADVTVAESLSGWRIVKVENVQF